MIPSETRAKVKRLADLLRDLSPVLVAYSGGVDSTYLLSVALDVLGRERVLAAFGLSPSVAWDERRDALEFLERAGARYRVVETRELEDPRYAANPSNRCYFCKSELFTRLEPIRIEAACRAIIDGTNADDLHDYRPGMQAGAERGVRRPLLEVELTKAEIRALSKERGLPTWDKLAAPCLSSRIAYGTPVTVGALSRIDRAERALRNLGFRELRVRHHDKLARIEVPVEDLPRLVDPAVRTRVVEELRAIGYAYVTLDLAGFRSGSGNEVLSVGSQVPSPAAR